MATDAPLSIKDFAAKLKAKYPDYKDIEDTDLVNRVVSKYPEYKDKVDLSPLKKKEPSQPTGTGLFGDIAKGFQTTSNTEQPNNLNEPLKPIDNNRGGDISSGSQQQQKSIKTSEIPKENNYLAVEKPKEIDKTATDLKNAPKSGDNFDGIAFMKQDIIDNGGGTHLKDMPTALESLNQYFGNDATNATDYFKRRTKDIDNRISELSQSLADQQQKRIDQSDTKGDIKPMVATDKINKLTGKPFEQPVPEDESKTVAEINKLKDYKNNLSRAQDVLAKKYTNWLAPNASLTEKGKLYNKLTGDENAQEQQRLEDKGIPLTQEQQYNTDIKGLDTYKQQLEDEYEGKPKDDAYYQKLAQLNTLDKGVLNKYPEFKRQQGGNLIAELAVKDPMVAMLAQSGSGELDKKMTDYLQKKYDVNPKDLKGLEYGDIPHESFLGNVAKEITNAGTSLLTGATRLGGTALGIDEDRLSHINQKISSLGDNLFGNNPYEHLQESPTLVNKDLQTIANPNAGKYNYTASTIKNAIGSGIGNLVGFIAGSKGLGKIANLADDAAMTSYMIGSGAENNYHKAENILGKDAPESEKALVSMGFGYADALAFKFLPKDKIFFGSAETKAAEKDFANSLKGLDISSINKEVLEPKLTKLFKALTGTTEETAKIGGAMTVAEMAKTTASVMLGDKKDASKHIEEGLANVKGLLRDLPFSMGIPLGLMEIPKYANHSNQFKETLFDAGQNPETHTATIRQAEDKGIITKAEADKKIEVVKTMNNVVKSTPTENPTTGEPLTHKQQVEYAYNRVKEIAQLAKKDNVSGDVALAQHYDKQAKELVDERKAILDGTQDEYKNTSDLYDRIKQKGTQHNVALNAGTKTEGVDYLSEQALQAPYSVKKSLGGDAELTTDLIARNSPEDIKSEIKDLKEKQKKADDNEKKAESNEYQRHIDLLEAGLEKTKPKKEVKAEELPTLSEPIDSTNNKGIPLEENMGQPEDKGEATALPTGNEGVVSDDVMKGVNDKMKLTGLEMEFGGKGLRKDTLSFKSDDVEIVIAKPLGMEQYQVTVSEKSNSNTGYTMNEGKTKLFDSKLEALEYAKEQKEKSLSNNKEADKVVDGSVGGDVETKRIETEAKIKRKDLFSDGGVFANELGGSGVNSVPTNHSERNGIEFVQFSNPNTGIVDVIMTGKSDNDFVGYYRIYENGKATNKWSSKFENQSRNKEDFKTMISGVQEMLPQGHEYTEKTSISTDGLRIWNQQLSRGYELQYDSKGDLITTRVAINGDAINNELGIAVNKGDFENVSVTNNADMKKVKEALLPYLQKFGLNGGNIHFENGTVEIDLPVLKNTKAVEQSLKETPKADKVGEGGNLDNSTKNTKLANDEELTKQLPDTLSPTEKQGSLRGGEANAEATVITGAIHSANEAAKGRGEGLSTEKLKDKEGQLLESHAKENGTWIKDDFGEPDSNGFEQDVYINPDGKTVTKVHSNTTHDTWNDLFHRIAIHNSLFPDVAYTLKGFTKHNGELAAVFEQPLITKGGKVSFEEVKTELAKLGFTQINPENKNPASRYNFENKETGVELSDLHGENVMKGKDGKLHFIDPIITLSEDRQTGKTKVNENNNGEGNTKKEVPSNIIKEKGVEGDTVGNEPIPTEAGINTENPITETVPSSESGDDESGKAKGITHAAVDELRKMIDLPEYEGKPVETHEKLIAEAKDVIKNNPNAANEVLDKMENDKEVTNKDNAIMAIYKATLDAELEKNPTKELLERATRVAKALDISGTKAGKLLESRKLVGEEDNLTNFLLQKQAAQGTALTETQIKNEAAKYEELKIAKDALEKQLEIEREQHKKDIAELGLNKAKAKARKEAKKSDADYKAERKVSVDAAREALKQIRENPQSSALPGFRELAAIAPHVKDFLNSLVSQGVDKLDNAVTQIHAEFKDVLDGLTKRNVLDILAGDYDEKKELTRNEKANTVRLLKREANLLKELEKVRKGEEKSKSEKDKVSTNRRIDELKEKIKEVRGINKNRGIDNESPEDATAGEIEYNIKLQKQLNDKAQKLTNDISTKKYLEEKNPDPVFKKSQKTLKLEDKVIDLENKIRHERSKDEYEKRGKARKVFDKIMEVLGIRRLVQSAVDISVPFRQGATLISPRRIDTWTKAFGANLKSVFSPQKFERIMNDIRKDSEYHEMIKDNIVFNDMGAADPNLHNEDFRKSFIYKIPILSEPLNASNRSADAFLNYARYDMYKKMRRVMEQKGLTRESDPKAFKYMGNWVMSMTGRGKMHKSLEAPAMNAVLGNTFYGARLMASRFNLLNPVTYFDPIVPKQAKVEAMKDLASFTVTTVAIGAALATMTGAKISLNPDDSDFLQLRYGDKVYDISGGLSNYIRTFMRIAKAGYVKATGTKYEGQKAADNAGNSIVNFFRNKLSPNTAYATDAFFGGRYGQKFDPYEIVRIYPMYTDDVIKAVKDQGLMAIPTVLLPNLLGIGYGSYASKGQIDKNLDDLLERNLRSDEMNNEKIKNYNDGGRSITFKEFNQFADNRDKEIEKDIKVLYEKGINGTPYKELSKEQVADEIKYIKVHATEKVKEEMFGKQKKTINEKRDDKKLSKNRDKQYNNN